MRTADERNYLQRRLDETVAQAYDEEELEVTLQALLSEREARYLTD